VAWLITFIGPDLELQPWSWWRFEATSSTVSFPVPCNKCRLWFADKALQKDIRT
jgi:hypothetical protein